MMVYVNYVLSKNTIKLLLPFIAFRRNYFEANTNIRGPGSSVGIATELRAGLSEFLIPVGAKCSAPVQTGPGTHPASCTMGSESFPGLKSGRGVTLTPHPLLMPWSRKSTIIPLHLLWTVRPVQSLSACTTVHLNFT